MLGRLFKRKNKGPPRAHLVVEIDPTTGAVGFDLIEPFVTEEAEAILEAALGRARDLTEDLRQQRVDAIIRDAQRELGVMDKLRRRGSRWEAEARNVVPTELFTGEAGRGLVEVTIDGELGFVTITVSDETGPEGTPGLALEALRHAEEQARERWFACLKGALEQLPESDKVELGLPAPAAAAAKAADVSSAPELAEEQPEALALNGSSEGRSEDGPEADAEDDPDDAEDAPLSAGSHTAFPDEGDEDLDAGEEGAEDPQAEGGDRDEVADNEVADGEATDDADDAVR